MTLVFLFSFSAVTLKQTFKGWNCFFLGNRDPRGRGEAESGCRSRLCPWGCDKGIGHRLCLLHQGPGVFPVWKEAPCNPNPSLLQAGPSPNPQGVLSKGRRKEWYLNTKHQVKLNCPDEKCQQWTWSRVLSCLRAPRPHFSVKCGAEITKRRRAKPRSAMSLWGVGSTTWGLTTETTRAAPGWVSFSTCWDRDIYPASSTKEHFMFAACPASTVIFSSLAVSLLHEHPSVGKYILKKNYLNN